MKFGKALSAAIAAVYLSSNSVFLHAAESNFWADRRRQGAPAGPAVASLPAEMRPDQILKSLPSVDSQHLGLLTPALSEQLASQVSKASAERIAAVVAGLPAAAGTVRKISIPADGRVDRIVVHIQDVHMNAEAQANIGQAVQSVIDGGKAGVVGLEGAFGPIDFARERAFPDKGVMAAVADYLLKELLISGPVHAAMTSEKEIPAFVGVDDQNHYDANVEAYRRSAGRQAGYKERLGAIGKTLAAEKASAFNPTLKDFDDRVQAYRDGRASLGEYVSSLASSPAAGGDVKAFVEALKMESSLDFPKVEKERAALVQELVQKLDRAGLQDLVSESVAYRVGNVRHADYYAHLRELCRRHGVDLSRWKAMDGYIKYVAASDRIDAERLFVQIQSLERGGYARLAKTAAEKDLVARDRALHFAAKLVDFSLTPEEWGEYQALKKDSAFSEIPRTIRLGSFENFYKEAEARNDAVTSKLLQAMAEKKTDVAVLVTGGFHAPGLEQRFHRAGATVVTYVPKLTKVDALAGSSYLSVFTQEKTPLDKLFAGEKLFTAPSPVRGRGQEADATVSIQSLRSGKGDKGAAQAMRDLLAPEGSKEWEEVSEIRVKRNVETHELKTADGSVVTVRALYDDKNGPAYKITQSARLPFLKRALKWTGFIGILGIAASTFLTACFETIIPTVHKDLPGLTVEDGLQEEALAGDNPATAFRVSDPDAVSMERIAQDDGGESLSITVRSSDDQGVTFSGFAVPGNAFAIQNQTEDSIAVTERFISPSGKSDFAAQTFKSRQWMTYRADPDKLKVEGEGYAKVFIYFSTMKQGVDHTEFLDHAEIRVKNLSDQTTAQGAGTAQMDVFGAGLFTAASFIATLFHLAFNGFHRPWSWSARARAQRFAARVGVAKRSGRFGFLNIFFVAALALAGAAGCGVATVQSTSLELAVGTEWAIPMPAGAEKYSMDLFPGTFLKDRSAKLIGLIHRDGATTARIGELWEGLEVLESLASTRAWMGRNFQIDGTPIVSLPDVQYEIPYFLVQLDAGNIPAMTATLEPVIRKESGEAGVALFKKEVEKLRALATQVDGFMASLTGDKMRKIREGIESGSFLSADTELRVVFCSLLLQKAGGVGAQDRNELRRIVARTAGVELLDSVMHDVLETLSPERLQSAMAAAKEVVSPELRPNVQESWKAFQRLSERVLGQSLEPYSGVKSEEPLAAEGKTAPAGGGVQQMGMFGAGFLGLESVFATAAFVLFNALHLRLSKARAQRFAARVGVAKRSRRFRFLNIFFVAVLALAGAAGCGASVGQNAAAPSALVEHGPSLEAMKQRLPPLRSVPEVKLDAMVKPLWGTPNRVREAILNTMRDYLEGQVRLPEVKDHPPFESEEEFQAAVGISKEGFKEVVRVFMERFDPNSEMWNQLQVGAVDKFSRLSLNPLELRAGMAMTGEGARRVEGYGSAIYALQHQAGDRLGISVRRAPVHEPDLSDVSGESVTRMGRLLRGADQDHFTALSYLLQVANREGEAEFLDYYGLVKGVREPLVGDVAAFLSRFKDKESFRKKIYPPLFRSMFEDSQSSMGGVGDRETVYFVWLLADAARQLEEILPEKATVGARTTASSRDLLIRRMEKGLGGEGGAVLSPSVRPLADGRVALAINSEEAPTAPVQEMGVFSASGWVAESVFSTILYGVHRLFRIASARERDSRRRAVEKARKVLQARELAKKQRRLRFLIPLFGAALALAGALGCGAVSTPLADVGRAIPAMEAYREKLDRSEEAEGRAAKFMDIILLSPDYDVRNRRLEALNAFYSLSGGEIGQASDLKIDGESRSAGIRQALYFFWQHRGGNVRGQASFLADGIKHESGQEGVDLFMKEVADLNALMSMVNRFEENTLTDQNMLKIKQGIGSDTEADLKLVFTGLALLSSRSPLESPDLDWHLLQRGLSIPSVDEKVLLQVFRQVSPLRLSTVMEAVETAVGTAGHLRVRESWRLFQRMSEEVLGQSLEPFTGVDSAKRYEEKKRVQPERNPYPEHMENGIFSVSSLIADSILSTIFYGLYRLFSRPSARLQERARRRATDLDAVDRSGRFRFLHIFFVTVLALAGAAGCGAAVQTPVATIPEVGPSVNGEGREAVPARLQAFLRASMEVTPEADRREMWYALRVFESIDNFGTNDFHDGDEAPPSLSSIRNFMSLYDRRLIEDAVSFWEAQVESARGMDGFSRFRNAAARLERIADSVQRREMARDVPHAVTPDQFNEIKSRLERIPAGSPEQGFIAVVIGGYVLSAREGEERAGRWIAQQAGVPTRISDDVLMQFMELYDPSKVEKIVDKANDAFAKKYPGLFGPDPDGTRMGDNFWHLLRQIVEKTMAPRGHDDVSMAGQGVRRDLYGRASKSKGPERGYLDVKGLALVAVSALGAVAGPLLGRMAYGEVPREDVVSLILMGGAVPGIVFLLVKGAMKALASIKHLSIRRSNSIPRLLRIFENDPKWRQVAMERLVELRSPESVTPLIEMLTGHLNMDVKKWAAWTLARMKETEALTVLKSIALSTGDNGYRWIVMSAVKDISRASFEDLKKELLKSSSHRVRVKVLTEIDSPDSIPDVAPLLDDRVPEVRAEAAEALRRTASPEAIPLLVKAYSKHDDVTTRWSVIRALGYLRAEEFLPTLLNVLSASEEPTLREAAALALGRIKSPEAIPALGRILMEYKHMEVRRAAARALGYIGTEAAAVLLRKAMPWQVEEDESVRMAVVEALAEMQDRGSIPQLMELMVHDPSDHVRWMAVIKLGSLPEFLPAVEKAALSDPAIDVRFRAIFSLTFLGTPEAAEILRRVSSTGKEEGVRRLARESLKEMERKKVSVGAQRAFTSLGGVAFFSAGALAGGLVAVKVFGAASAAGVLIGSALGGVLLLTAALLISALIHRMRTPASPAVGTKLFPLSRALSPAQRLAPLFLGLMTAAQSLPAQPTAAERSQFAAQIVQMSGDVVRVGVDGRPDLVSAVQSVDEEALLAETRKLIEEKGLKGTINGREGLLNVHRAVVSTNGGTLAETYQRALQEEAGRTPVTVVVVTRATLAGLPKILGASLGHGPVALIVAESGLKGEIDRLAQPYAASVAVEERLDLVSGEDQNLPPSVALLKLRETMDQSDKLRHLLEKIGGAAAYNLTLPAGLGLDPSGLDPSDPLRTALVIILDALNAVAIRREDFDKMQRVAAVLARQA